MKKGFTLAEVLVTLTIIGVVAALTVPSLIQDTISKEHEVAKLKAKSSVINGYKKMLSLYGLTDIRNLPMWSCTTKECFSNEHRKVFTIVMDSTDDNIITAFNNEKHYNAAYALTFEQEYRTKTGTKTVNWGELPYAFITNDGMIFGITNLDYEDNYSFDVLVDTNCARNPNKIGADYTEFTMRAYAEIDNKELGDDAYEDVETGTGPNNGNNQDNNSYEDSENNNGNGNGNDKEDNPNKGPGNNNGNGNGNDKEDNPNKGPGNNSGNGNGNDKEDNPNKGPGNNSGNGNGNDKEDNPNKGPGNNSGNN